MAKYSTGGSAGGGSGGSCELCGTTTDDLRTAKVAGATLEVCADCAAHGEDEGRGGASGGDESGTGGGRDRSSKQVARNAARALDAATGDSTHWEEEGTNYEGDQLPYLVTDYGERVVRARQDAGLQREELAADLDISENDLLAVEQGRATRAGVGGSVIAALEERLDVELAEK